MIDTEVVRLRALRAHALKVRAIARALRSTEVLRENPELQRAQCAAWRVARAVSGRLHEHPYAPFQRGPGLATLFMNSLAGAWAALLVRDRMHALRRFGDQLRAMARELDDARALTWAADLSDSLGRSQAELKSLFSSLPVERSAARGAAVGAASGSAPLPTDWPYLAL